MDPFVGEIRLFGFNFPTRGWALCNGALLPIQQNTALFALLGTQYGGNGTTTFALPDLRGRAIVGKGQGAGLSNYPQGAQVGTENVTLLATEMPAHTHTLSATVPVSPNTPLSSGPQGGYFANSPTEQYGETPDHGVTGTVLSGTSGVAGGGQPHENRMPSLVLNYCIALQGVFPQRQ